MAESYPDFTPVNLITGFLGSGKTTLLGRLLRQPELAGAAVLINEFGEVGLDHHLLETIDDNIVLLQSGCLCCTIRGDLSAAMRSLHSKRDRREVPARGRRNRVSPCKWPPRVKRQTQKSLSRSSRREALRCLS